MSEIFNIIINLLYLFYSSSEPVITDGDYLPDNIEVMTPIIDGLRRLSEGIEDTDAHDSEHETIKTSSRHYSDTTSTDTFQTNDSRDYIERSRKTSKTETNNDLSSLRNLSTNGLMMFDPLVINAVPSTDANRQLPDHDLVTSLNEQVTEIADRLSSIAASDVEIIDHNQMHSFSTNDVPSLIATDETEAFGFTGPRNEQLSCMPSTSHGYLIPNAISHEPVVLSSLSHNSSAVFNQDEESGNDVNGAILNADLPLIIPDNIDADIVNTNISIANANLSSLLLTNEEYSNYVGNENADGDDTSFHSAKMTIEREDERVKFMLGYESDHESPVDSGVSTENTSLDRSPDTEGKGIKELKDNHFMQQNRVLKSPESEVDVTKHTKNTLESSFSDVNNETVNISYVEDESSKNEAGSSSSIMEKVLNRLSSDEEGLNEASNEHEARRVLQDWGANVGDDEFRTIDEVITELRRHREADKKISTLVEEDNNVSSNADVGPSTQSSSRPKKSRKSSTKSKKKKTKIWSPSMVILDNRSTQNQNSPLRLNLDHFVDEG